MNGVYLFGSEGSDYSVSLTLYQFQYSIFATVVSTKGTFSSLHNKSKNYWGFDVLFDSPLSIIKGTRYGIIASLRGPDSFGGRNGNSHVESSGVTFTFENWTGTTGVEQGQLPEFIFSLQE